MYDCVMIVRLFEWGRPVYSLQYSYPVQPGVRGDYKEGLIKCAFCQAETTLHLHNVCQQWSAGTWHAIWPSYLLLLAPVLQP